MTKYQEQGEEQQRGRGARRQGQWEHSTRPYFLLYFDTFHFHFLSLCLFSAFKSVLAWQRAEWDPKLLPQPPPNYFNNKLVCRPCPKRTEGDTQKYKDLHQSWLENHSSKRSSLKTTKHDLINKGLVCLYTLKKKICQGVTDAGHTHTLRGKHSTELLSLKFKLSQATIPKMVFFYDEN